MSTRLLIDGYNLLFASDVFASTAGPPTLQRTRDALLQFLAGSLDKRLLARTVVVFDATYAPPGLPHDLTIAGLKVMFSRGGQDADALLEDLIAAERAPRQLLVVSSDHRVQRAARQRGAKFADSEQWLRELHSRQRPTESAPSKPEGPSHNSAELQKWLQEFGDVDSRRLETVDPLPHAASLPPPAADSPPRKAKSGKKKAENRASDDEKPQTRWNPFPPGYGEDLLDQ
jgi:predicted RNA-binding protein with PIN domain